jgi:hypothetical protein
VFWLRGFGVSWCARACMKCVGGAAIWGDRLEAEIPLSSGERLEDIQFLKMRRRKNFDENFLNQTDAGTRDLATTFAFALRFELACSARGLAHRDIAASCAI